VRLTLTENRSVLLSFRRRGGAVRLRLHRMFLHAPVPVVRAVARGLRRRTSRSADGDVRRFMNENLHRVRRVPRTLPPLLTRGQVHDLQHVYDRLNTRFFASTLRVPLTWGRGSGRARRGGLTFGSYDPVLAIIRIHPVLDRPRCARLFPGERRLPRDAAPPHGRVPDAAGRTVYHSRAFPRGGGPLPAAAGGAGLGEGEPPAPAAGEPGAGQAAQGESGGAARLMGGARRGLPHLRGLLPYLRRHRRRLLVGLLCLLATTALSAASPWVLRYAWTTWPCASRAPSSICIPGLIVGLVLVEGAFRYQMRMSSSPSAARSSTSCGATFSAGSPCSLPRFYQTHRVGDLMSRRHQRPLRGAHGAGPGIMYTANTAATFVATIVLMLRISPPLLALALVPLFFVSFLARVIGRRIHDRFESVQAQLAEMNAVVQENLSGARVVRAYAQEPQRWRASRRPTWNTCAATAPSSACSAACTPASSSSWAWGGDGSVAGRRPGREAAPITLGEYVAFGAYLAMLHWP
jgi:hypothetical protein